MAGRSGVGFLTYFDCSDYPVKIAGQLDGFDPALYMEEKQAKRMKRFCQYALAAARLAWQDASLPVSLSNPGRAGACFGSTVSGYLMETEHASYQKRGIRAIRPGAWSELNTHAATSYVNMEFGLKGPSTSVSAGCCTGLDTLGWGFRTISENHADIAIVGAADAPITPFGFSMMCASKLLTTYDGDPVRASRPFARGRDGSVLSEGAAVMVLEEMESALKRGATIYAEILGYASRGEAQDMINIDTSGVDIAEAMLVALSQAGLSTGDVDYIQAHGSAFPAGDLADINAVKAAFGERAYNIPVSSIRSMIGQPLAAGGVLQVAATVMAVRYGVLPPTINCEDPDPLCDLDLVNTGARAARIRHAFVNSTSVGGTHASILIGRYLDCEGASCAG